MRSSSGVGFPRLRIAILGAVTIAVYGAWFYAFGVLLDPIIEDTGWSEGALASTYAVSMLISGIGGLGGGWLLDRFGSRFVFATGGLVSLAAFVVAAAAETLATFAVAAAIGGGALGAFAFYHVTQTVAVRISPQAHNRAIAVLTIWGAFASVLAIPFAAWLEQRVGWRPTMIVLSTVAAASLLVAAAAVRSEGAAGSSVREVVRALAASLTGRVVRRFLVSQALAGVSISVILVYQVPAMTSAGLSVGAASAIAGFRGFAQLGGRLPLSPLVAWLGVGRSMRLAYATIVAGAVFLAYSGTLLPAILFAVLAGFGVGALSALVGMYAAEVFATGSLGTAMGLTSLVFGAVGASGPALAGWVAEATGSRVWPVVAAGGVAFLAAVVLDVMPERA